MDLYFIYFIIYSFIGFILETTYVFLMDKKLTQRGFLWGPVIPIYGFGALAIIIALSSYKNKIVLIFVLGIILTSTLEYITSYVMEKLFDMRWWDYSQRKYNINGRICLRNSLMIGILSVLLIQWIHPLISQFTLSFSNNTLKILASVSFVMLMIDWTWSMLEVLNFKHYIQEMDILRNKALDYLREQKIIGNVKDFMMMQDEFIDEKYKNLRTRIHQRHLDFQQRQKRLLARFPLITSKRYEDIIEKIKEANKK